jgi:hypothetical protein
MNTTAFGESIGRTAKPLSFLRTFHRWRGLIRPMHAQAPNVSPSAYSQNAK